MYELLPGFKHVGGSARNSGLHLPLEQSASFQGFLYNGLLFISKESENLNFIVRLQFS